MSHRYRLVLAPGQEAGLLEHCRHARFVWNLAVEQHLHWRPDRCAAPDLAEQCRQLTDARAAFDWLAAGSVTVPQQALRDFHQAMRLFFRGASRRPGWPEIGWVSFRWSRPVPAGVRSYRITRDAAGRWHVAFAGQPSPIPAPDWVEKTSTRQKAGLNRAILTAGWGRLVTRLEQKAPGRVEKISPAYTSQRCSRCGRVDNADVNAARNIAAGRVVNARGGDRVAGPVSREPHLVTSAT